MCTVLVAHVGKWFLFQFKDKEKDLKAFLIFESQGGVQVHL